MLLKKEIFNKFTKLISAGIIQTSAKDLKGLSINEILNLPIYGNQKIIFNEFVFINSESDCLELKLKDYLVLLKKLYQNETTLITKQKNLYSSQLQYNYCSLVSNDCNIDINYTKQIYKLDFGNDPEIVLTTIETLLNDSNAFEKLITKLQSILKQLYINPIIDTSLDNYNGISYIKENLITELKNNDDSMDNNTINELINQWYGDIINNSEFYINFELKLIDEQISEENILWLNINEILNPIV